jgi:hypothetical protein
LAFHWETLGFSQSLWLESEEKTTADRAMLLKQSDRNDDKNVARERYGKRLFYIFYFIYNLIWQSNSRFWLRHLII